MDTERRTTPNGALLHQIHYYKLLRTISLPNQIESISKEANIILAIQALQKDPIQSVRAFANIYHISETTLRFRRKNQPSRRDQFANFRKLNELEESVIVR